MRKIKELINLLDKAEDAGHAILNGQRESGCYNTGRIESSYYARMYGDKLELHRREIKYYARIYGDELELQHRGKTILVMSTDVIEYAYVGSKSDVDAIKTAIYYMTSGVEYEDVHYYPSTGKSFIGGKEITNGKNVNIVL